MFLGLTGTKPKPLLEETDNCRTKLPSKLAINLPFSDIDRLTFWGFFSWPKSPDDQRWHSPLLEYKQLSISRPGLLNLLLLPNYMDAWGKSHVEQDSCILFAWVSGCRKQGR